MAIVIEGFCVVAHYNRIKPLLDDESIEAPNSTEITDDYIWRCSFMVESDAQRFLKVLEKLGLNISQGPDSDVVLANEFDRSVEPYCEWLRTGAWDKAIIAWKEGTEPKSVMASEGWDPKLGSGLEFHNLDEIDDLEFLRVENNVEVFFNKKTGEEVYTGRASTPIDSMFSRASDVVQKYLITAGQSKLTGEPEKEVREAAETLKKVIDEEPEWWNAQWFYGKSQVALGNYDNAYTAFQCAYEVEQETEAILRELGGVCLELGKFDEAASVGEKALSLDADNPELLGNLALSYLLAGRNAHSRKAIDFALKLDPNDKINQSVERILSEVESGERKQPNNLNDITTPSPPKKTGLVKWLSKLFG